MAWTPRDLGIHDAHRSLEVGGQARFGMSAVRSRAIHAEPNGVVESETVPRAVAPASPGAEFRALAGGRVGSSRGDAGIFWEAAAGRRGCVARASGVRDNSPDQRRAAIVTLLGRDRARTARGGSAEMARGKAACALGGDHMFSRPDGP